MLTRKRWLAPLLLVGLVRCSSSDGGEPSSPSTGGVPATGGAATSGGVPVTGGTANTGGATPTGGAAPTGGIAATGGAAHTGGAATMTGGATATGGAPSSGGASVAGGGAGGATPGGASSGGATSAGAGGQGSLPTVAELFPSDGPDGALDGRLVTMPCASNGTSDDCTPSGAYYRSKLIACSGNVLDVSHTYPVGGVEGQKYKVTFHFYGVVEPRDYGPDVMREASNRPGNQDSGAMPTPWAVAKAGHKYSPADYDTYELRIDDQNDQEVAAYYLNADTMQGHWTYALNFSKQIEVIGGGRVRARIYDQNCKGIKNCGNPGTYPCESKARTIDVSKAEPKPAATPATEGGLLQPALIPERNANNAGQWLLIDVVSVDG